MKVNENEILNNLLIKQTEFSLVDDKNATTIRHRCQQLKCCLLFFILYTPKTNIKRTKECKRVNGNDETEQNKMGKKETDVAWQLCSDQFNKKKHQILIKSAYNITITNTIHSACHNIQMVVSIKQ